MNKLLGIDISYHQGDIDFKKVKESGIQFLIIRAGYRTTTDPKFFEYVKQAKEVGIEIRGIYFFSYALNVQEAVKEAEFSVKLLEEAGLGRDTIVFYDFEYDTVEKAKEKGVVLTKTECVTHTIEFCETVRRLGYTPGVYTNIDYYKNWYESNQTIFDKYVIWLADYTGGPDFECQLQQYSNVGKVPGINTNVDMVYWYDEQNEKNESIRSRSAVVNLATSWIGKNEKDESFKEIINIYNSQSILPRGLKMQYDWPWCACTWSALAVALGYEDVMPIEISCGELIKLAQNKGIFIEDDFYVPKPGDAILYDWQDDGYGDNVGWPDHIGIVEWANENTGYITTIEGNYDDSVKKRTISINGRYIRGFITPKYNYEIVQNPTALAKDTETLAHEVIAGLWGNGEARKILLEEYGYNYSEIQMRVNEILNTPKQQPENVEAISTTCYAKSFDKNLSGIYATEADLYCRNDAGTNKKALCIIPKGTNVRCYGFYTECAGVKWFLIEFALDGVKYTGFSSEKYLKRA